MALALLSVGCSYANTGPDEFACAYGGGLFEAETQKGTFEPGSGRDFVGMGDTIIELPANIRNYIIDKDPGSGDVPDIDFIRTPTGDGTQLDYELSVRFRINTDIGCDFWDETGKRFDIDEPEGWSNFLDQNLRPIIENTMKSESQAQGDWEDVWRNRLQDGEPTWTIMQNNIGSRIVTEVNRSLGDDFLCGVSWEPGDTTCPAFEVLIKSAQPQDESLMSRYTDIQAAEAATELQTAELNRERERVIQQEANKLAEEQARIEREVAIAEGEIEIAELRLEQARLDGEAEAVKCVELAKAGVDCTLLAAAENGSIDFWVLDPDAPQQAPLITREVG